MSVAQAPGSPTRTSPARAPDGFPFSHTRYRWYILFGATGLVLAVDALVLLRAVQVLGQGPAAWDGFVASFASPLGMILGAVLVVGTLFFAFRWLRVGVKVPTVRIGSLPAAPAPVVLVAHFVGLVVFTALALLLLGGIIL
jgi:fumarate reductase subunit C